MSEPVLAHYEEFIESCGRFAELSNETIFTYCSFTGFEISTPSIEGALIYCGFERIAFYWELFNTALISHTNFTDCVFSGCSFRGVDFINCSFTRCRFELDNLGGACVFEDCRLVECVFDKCAFIKDERPEAAPLFEKTRFYGCIEEGTRGERLPFG